MPSTHALPDIIDGKAVKSLAQAHAIRGAVILGQPGGWAVLVRYGATEGMVERAVAAQRSRRLRLWRNLNTAAAFVRDELGVPRFEVDTAGHDRTVGARKRPDQAERLRRQREAAAHDAWFRAEVQKTLDGVAVGTVETVTHDEHAAHWRRKRAELLARAERGQ